MIPDQLIDKLLSLMEDELTLIQSYNQGCEKLHQFVISKDWKNLEKKIISLKQQAARLVDADNEREWVVNHLKHEMDLPEECSFGLLISRFPQEKSREINDLKRNLRRSVMILQGRVRGLGKYTENQAGALKDVLDILVPDQKGKIYNRYGSANKGGQNPLLVNRHF